MKLRRTILTILNLLTHEHGIYLHLFSSLISFTRFLRFSSQILYIFFRFTAKQFFEVSLSMLMISLFPPPPHPPPHHAAFRILVPQLGIERAPLQWKQGVLTTGPFQGIPNDTAFFISDSTCLLFVSRITTDFCMLTLYTGTLV